MNIWVNGCFDILHTGHLDLFQYAKVYCDGKIFDETNKLFVGVDTDERVKQLKGDKRPINSLLDRVRMLKNLVMVDNVVDFNTDEELRQYVRIFDIDYIVVGDHYKDKPVIGRNNAKHGVIYYPTDERSSTDIIEKIMNL